MFLTNQPIAVLVAALRSGEYKQARRHLSVMILTGGWSYCCLGVACDIMPGFMWHEDKLRSAGTPPPKVIDLYNFTDVVMNWLMVLNDTDYKSFEAIADAIVERTVMGIDGQWVISDWPVPPHRRVAA